MGATRFFSILYGLCGVGVVITAHVAGLIPPEKQGFAFVAFGIFASMLLGGILFGRKI